MKYKGLDTTGSFEAWGLGLNYIYDNQSRILDIVHARRNKPLIYIDFDSSLSKDPLAYIGFLEKSSQIRALMLSNNKTADISETMDDNRLCAILSSVAGMARYCFDLKNEKYTRFEKYFVDEHDIKAINIERTKKERSNILFFKAKLETHKSNTAVGHGSTMFRALSALSDNIIHDLLTTECGYDMQSLAHGLLRISYTLSAFSCVLNDRFVPIHKITAKMDKRKAV